MKTYLVGGAVRDALLGLPVKDRDWVVVGATPERMVAQGFKPVGQDFPVFLHPVTHEEYALARTERKTAPGYRGFVVHAAPDVTLEQDLARRDITINSIAVDAIDLATNGTFLSKARLIDPFGGQNDLKHKVLRHVTLAFREDPVRILRVARFAARFADFSLAPETLQLMRDMVQSGEVAALVPERVWQELSCGLMENTPSRLLEMLALCGALSQVLGVPQHLTPGQPSPTSRDFWRVLDQAAKQAAPLPVRLALLSLLMNDLGASLSASLPRLPRDCSELAALLGSEVEQTRHCEHWTATQWLQWLLRCDAFRRPQRLLMLVSACEIWLQRSLPAAGVWAAVQSVRLPRAGVAGATPVDAIPSGGPAIGERLNAARVLAIAQHLASTRPR